MTKHEKLLDLLHRADVTFGYWDSKKSGAVERDITPAERKLLIVALRKTIDRASIIGPRGWRC